MPDVDHPRRRVDRQAERFVQRPARLVDRELPLQGLLLGVAQGDLHDQQLVLGETAAVEAVLGVGELLPVQRDRLRRHVVQALGLEQREVGADDDHLLLERGRPHPRASPR